ncbi:SRPBCC family protein [Pelagibius sp. Alg239-R121]|uniref:SRPBCC family protein n=1 Tax=Pelagibius sp. Alg239-R121 TaxID=2993448 RepID=UPI0024A699B1|nr:SRPBCC family protein [Pelagibius sp. Alg239-R121]
MVEVRRSTVIDAPIDEVWRILRDFNGHDRWHPAVAVSKLEGADHTDQVGAVRDFRLTGGERVREQLLSLSDKTRSFSYAIVDSDVPLNDYVAHVALKPVTDGTRTFWNWHSKFRPPAGREQELAALVAEGVYEAGFSAIRTLLSGQAAAQIAGSIEGQAIMVARHGGPEELRLAPVQVPPPGPGEVRIEHSAIGVNFIDVYCRTGAFDLLQPPGIPGMEAAGIVIDVGPGVPHLAAGDRVGYACPPVGAYATHRTMAADLVFCLPDNVSNEVAAACLLKGITAEFLLHRVHRLKAGENVLVYAPAGGVGRMLCQWASHLGARVIGATSSPEKAEAARAAGARDIVVPDGRSLEAQVMELTNGQGANVIFDAVGRDSFAHSLRSLAVCGHLVSFGQASGPVGTWDIGALSARSATISRPNFGHFVDTPEKLTRSTARLFEALRDGVVTAGTTQRFPLADAALAHRALEARQTTGSTILIPGESA